MKKQVYKLGLVAILGLATLVNAQVGINEESPKATLEIKPNTQNVAESATTNEGVLIPQLTKKRVANIAEGGLTEGTLVYVKGTAYTPENATTPTPKDKRVEDVDSNGFYYYNATKWEKVGSSSKGPVFRNLRTVANISSTDWAADDFTIVFTDGLKNLALPDPTTNKDRVISVRNDAADLRTFTANPPKGNGGIRANRGMVLQSDGTEWFVIGGF